MMNGGAPPAVGPKAGAVSAVRDRRRCAHAA